MFLERWSYPNVCTNILEKLLSDEAQISPFRVMTLWYIRDSFIDRQNFPSLSNSWRNPKRPLIRSEQMQNEKSCR